MWDVLNKRPRGRLSLRTLHVLATGLIVAVLLCVGAVTKTAYADTKDALLKDGALQYDSKTFAAQPDLGANDPRNFSAGTHVFGYSASGSNKVEYIFIDGGVTIDKATVGAYVTYTYTPPSTYTDQSSPVQVNITHMTSDPTVATSNTCNGFGGLGWIFCPVVNSLSGAIDGIYSFITQFFDTPPLTSDSAIYKIWDAVRSIANIVFVIAFLILIYSQVTSLGISKYGIRSMLPRLIVAAILVNISYWVCSLGIDLSNFLGHSVESFFMSYLSTLQGTTVIPDWSTLTQALIGGGAAGGALIGGIWFSVATAGSAPALVFILLGMAVSVALALLAALIILAARQAILVIFTIVSPLAFAAMVLPSTEKLFDKWKDTMLSMLILFPLFGLVYGGAQVAGAAIVLGSKGNIFLLLLGKFVIFIPLAITPLLVKFSSGILGTVVGAVNDRKKGALDRFRNWNNEQIDFHRKMSLPKNGPIARFNPARRTARFFDNQKRRQTKDLEGAESRSATLAQSTRRYRRAYNYAQASGLEKEASDNNLKAQWDTRRRTDGRTMLTDTDNRKSASKAKEQADALEQMQADLIVGGAASPHLTNIKNTRLRARVASNAQSLKDTSESIAFIGLAKKLADAEHHSNVTNRLTSDEALRNTIGAIRGPEGAQLVHAMAVTDERKQYGEFVSAREQLYKHFKVDPTEISRLAKGVGDVEKEDSHGNKITFRTNDEFTREAAITTIFKVGAYGDVMDVVESSGEGGANFDFRSTVMDEFITNGKSKIAPFINDKAYSAILNGQYKGKASTRYHTVRRIQEGRLTAGDLAGAHANALKLLFESNDTSTPEWQAAHDEMFGHLTPAARTDAEAAYQENYGAMRESAIEVLRDPEIRQNTSRESINTIKDFLGIPRADRLDQVDWDTI